MCRSFQQNRALRVWLQTLIKRAYNIVICQQSFYISGYVHKTISRSTLLKSYSFGPVIRLENNSFSNDYEQCRNYIWLYWARILKSLYQPTITRNKARTTLWRTTYCKLKIPDVKTTRKSSRWYFDSLAKSLWNRGVFLALRISNSPLHLFDWGVWMYLVSRWFSHAKKSYN